MWKNIKLLAVTLVILFLVAEAVLRIVFDVQPGQRVSSPYFDPVSSVQVKHGFDADSFGIQKVEELSARVISSRIAAYHETGKTFAVEDTESNNVYDLVDFAVRFADPRFENDLKARVVSANFPANDLDSAIQYYLAHPVNEYGFRSIPFRQYRSAKKKVLLLGDSFTWGHSASNIFSSFADNLLAKGYAAYNTGITCTDPVQYHQVVKKYVPLLQPDVVVMNVYLGNDVQYYYRQPLPYMPQMLPTNAGNLMTDFNGVLVRNPDSVYNIIANGTSIPIENSLFNKLCSYTSTTTLLWRVLAKFNVVNNYSNRYQFIWDAGNKIRKQKPDVNERIKEVEEICSANGAVLLVCVIPYMNQLSVLTGPSSFEGLFEGISYHLSPVPKEGFENRPDGHFNDAGHKAYAEFLDHLIDSVCKAKQ